MRRRLSLNPDHSVVLTYNSKKKWQQAGYATPEYKKIVGATLKNNRKWLQDSESRALFFLPYIANENLAIRELAYLEVGRASYATIRKADKHVPTSQVHLFLSNQQYIEWHALYILLLGVNASIDEKDLIRTTMEKHSSLNLDQNLSSWTTALIEIDQKKAIDWLDTAYITATNKKPELVTEVLKALSVQANFRGGELKQRIAESYQKLIQNHPTLAGWAARDLVTWADWRFAEDFSKLRQNKTKLDGSTTYIIDFYIRRANRLGTKPKPTTF